MTSLYGLKTHIPTQPGYVLPMYVPMVLVKIDRKPERLVPKRPQTRKAFLVQGFSEFLPFWYPIVHINGILYYWYNRTSIDEGLS